MVDVLDGVCRVNCPVTIGPFSFSSHVTYPFFDVFHFVIIAFAMDIQRRKNVEISSQLNALYTILLMYLCCFNRVVTI